MGRLRALHRSYGDRAEFLFVHIAEASHSMPEQDGILERAGLSRPVVRASDIEENDTPPEDPRVRAQRIETLLRHYGLRMSCLLDDEAKTAQETYSAWPQRLVLIDRRGRVTHDGGWGVPNGLDYAAAEERLRLMLSLDDGDPDPEPDPDPDPPAAEGT